jgi:hypothetical protein
MHYALAALVLLFSAQAMAQSLPCGDYSKIANKLRNDYNERITARSISSGDLLLLFTSKRGETFTILAVKPNKLACILATGENWERYKWSAPTQTH